MESQGRPQDNFRSREAEAASPDHSILFDAYDFDKDKSDGNSAAKTLLAPLVLLAVPGLRHQAFKSLGAAKVLVGEIGEKLSTKLESAAFRCFTGAPAVVESKARYAFRGTEVKYSGELPPVFSLKDLNLDKLVSPARRLDIAQQSPLYDLPLAQGFTLGLRRDLAPLLKDTREVYRPLSDDYRLFGELDKTVPEYGQFRKSVERFQPVLQRHAGNLAQELGIPRVKVAIDFAEEAGPGVFDLSSATLQVGYRQLLRPSKLSEVVYHESGHVEQTNLVLRELADRLGIGKVASSEELRVLNELAKKEFRISESIDSDYLRQVIALRNGEPLSASQLTRAQELKKSLAATGEGEKPINELEDEKVREYWVKSGRQTFTDFLEEDGVKLAEDTNSYGWRFKSDTQRFIGDYFRGKGDLSKLDLSLEDSAHAEMRSFFHKAVLKNNKARAFNTTLYRTSTHEIEAYELGQLTLKFR